MNRNTPGWDDNQVKQPSLDVMEDTTEIWDWDDEWASDDEDLQSINPRWENTLGDNFKELETWDDAHFALNHMVIRSSKRHAKNRTMKKARNWQ